MTVAFKTVLEHMAAGELEHVYAQAVISVDKQEIIWNGTGRRSGSIAVYSRNNVEIAGTVRSLHPAVVMKEDRFQGNTTLHYELVPGAVFCQEDWKTDGILLCYNGGEYVIPLHLKSVQQNKDSFEAEPVHEDIYFERQEIKSISESTFLREKRERIKITGLNLERLVLRFQGRKPERQAELLEQMTASVQLLAGLRQDCVRYKLYEALAALESGNLTHAAKLESRLRNVIVAAKKQYYTEYCILLYLQYQIALWQKQKRDAAVKKQQLVSYIQNALEKEPADHDLILLLCGDCLQLKETSPLDLWEVMSEVYYKGNSSPYLFFYGACLLENPQMERLLDTGLDSWTGHCLYEGIRRGIISRKMAERIAQCRPESYTSYICHIYEALYKQYPSRELLSALCTVMIRCDVRSERAFVYYEKAVESGMKIARLFDYYMYTLPSGYEKPVNREVLLYFSLDEYVNPQIYTRLCLNVIQFYSDDSQIYDHYNSGMRNFVKNQIMRSNWSEDLTLLAGEVLTPEIMDEELARAVIPMLYLVQVKAEVPDGCQVIFESGIYKEPQTGIFKNGKTCLYVPGGEGSFHLQDRAGRRIHGANLKVYPLMQDEELMSCCERFCPDDETLLLLKTHAWIIQKQFGRCDFRLCMQYFKDESLDENFRKKLLDFILLQENESSYGHVDIQAICSCSEMMNRQQMALFTEILIRKGFYTEAAGFLSGLSGDSVDDGLLLELAAALAQYPENESSPELMNLLSYLLNKGLLDDFLLQYLAENYQGKQTVMIDLYKDCLNRNLCCGELNQHLLLRLLMNEQVDYDLFQEIFISTVNLEPSELLIQAAVNRICHEYVCENCEIEADVMSALQSIVIHSGSVAGLTVPCQLACLKYDCTMGLNHEIEHIIMKKMCRNMMGIHMKLEFVQKEAMQYGLMAYPVLQVNLSSSGEFHENLFDQVREEKMTVWAEYQVVGESEKYQVQAFPVYGCLYSADVIMFAGEKISYRFYCGDKKTEWKEIDGWNYEYNQEMLSEEDRMNRESSRYWMLQDIAVGLQNGNSISEQMQKYERMLKLVDSVGKNINT